MSEISVERAVVSERGAALTAYLRATESVREEVDVTLRIAEGALPSALSGVPYRNGPGKMEVHGTKYDHPFDGHGMVTRFEIANGAVATATALSGRASTSRRRAPGRCSSAASARTSRAGYAGFACASRTPPTRASFSTAADSSRSGKENRKS